MYVLIEAASAKVQPFMDWSWWAYTYVPESINDNCRTFRPLRPLPTAYKTALYSVEGLQFCTRLMKARGWNAMLSVAIVSATLQDEVTSYSSTQQWASTISFCNHLVLFPTLNVVAIAMPLLDGVFVILLTDFSHTGHYCCLSYTYSLSLSYTSWVSSFWWVN